MSNVLDNVSLRLDEGDINVDFLDDADGVGVFLDELEIGSISVYHDESDNGECTLYVEHMAIDEEYRNIGVGSKALAILKSMSKQRGFKYIHGECKNARCRFYSNSGAVFDFRQEGDKEHINNRFYIDL